MSTDTADASKSENLSDSTLTEKDESMDTAGTVSIKTDKPQSK